MNTRILEAKKPGQQSWFIPQQNVDGLWREFYGYDEGSPYLRLMIFESEKDARDFLKSPTVYTPGKPTPSGYAVTIV